MEYTERITKIMTSKGVYMSDALHMDFEYHDVSLEDPIYVMDYLEESCNGDLGLVLFYMNVFTGASEDYEAVNKD